MIMKNKCFPSIRVLLTLFALAVFALSIAQTPSVKDTPPLSTGGPESVGMSPDRLAKFDEVAEKLVDSENLPGIVALVARNGKIVYHKAFGIANEKGDQLRKDHIFRIASQTKAITSTAVMILWEEGRFRLDDPISRYIPEFANPKVLTEYNEQDGTYKTRDASREITIRDLLTHSSGIGYGVIDGNPNIKKIYADAGVTDLFTTESITIEQSVKKLAKLPLHHDPGAKWTYSEGLDVLGYFIEVVSGLKFDDFLRQRLFDPLGMDDTWFYLPNDKRDRLVEVLTKEDNVWKKYPKTFYDTDYPIRGAKSFFSGGAGLSSTVLDYATFLQMYLNGGEYDGIRILSRKTVEFIMQNQLAEINYSPNNHQGLAFGVVNDSGESRGGLGSEGTFEWGGYFNTQYWADPQENLIGLLFKQTQGPVRDPSSWMFRQIVLSSIDD